MTSIAKLTYGNAITIYNWLKKSCPIITSHATYDSYFLYKLYLNINSFENVITEYESKLSNIMMQYGNNDDDCNQAKKELLSMETEISIEMINMHELKNIKMSYNTLKNLSFMIAK